MPDPPNVIEVDFARDDADILREAGSILDDLRELERRERWERASLHSVARWRGQRIRELEKQLRDAQPVTEDRVYEALAAIYDGEPVRAGAIAARLYDAPTHSTRVRVGHVLSRLEAAGKVRRQVHWYDCDHDSVHHRSWAPK
jgi:hypothetical protein